jgi:Flp pilus assembly pilin Flp
MGFFGRSEHGQDLAEYCLLVALVALIALGLMAHFSGGMQNIWNSANNTLASGSSSSNGAGSPASGQPSSQPVGGK